MNNGNASLHLSSRHVADLLDVHVSTVKRWTNSGHLRSQTTAGGHRRIHLDDVLEVAGERGIPTFLDTFAPFQGHVWRAVRDAEGSDFNRALQLAEGWLIRGYPQRVGDLFVTLAGRREIPLEQLLDRGIRAFSGRVRGEAVSGRLPSGSEHLVSQLLLEVLFRIRLRRTGSPEPYLSLPEGPVAVVASLEGDLHDVGVMGLRLLLEREGLPVYYLGPDVPVQEIAPVGRSQGASLISIAFGPRIRPGAIAEAVRSLSASYQRQSPYSLALSTATPVDLSKVPNPFETLVLHSSAEAFAAWIREWKQTALPERRRVSA